MPQLDPSSFASQIFWLAVCFVALYWIMARLAIPRIGAVLEERRNKIEGDLERAERLRSDAENVLAGYEAALADARRDAAAVLREAAEANAAEAAERTAALNDDINKRLAQADTRINDAKQAALADIHTVAGELAGSAAQKLAAVKPGASKIKAAVDKAVRETN